MQQNCEAVKFGYNPSYLPFFKLIVSFIIKVEFACAADSETTFE